MAEPLSTVLLSKLLTGFATGLVKSSGEATFNLFFQQEDNSSDALTEMIGKSLEEQSRLMREAIEQWQATQIQLNLQQIQANWDRDNWLSKKLNKQETIQMFQNSQQKHKLLVLSSQPKISKSCHQDIRNNLKLELPIKMKEFFDKYYSLSENLCPVEFYGDYFKESITDIDIRRLHDVLKAIPVVVIYTTITDYEVYFQVGFWGIGSQEPTILSIYRWNWEKEFQKLQIRASIFNFNRREEDRRKKAHRQIRELIINFEKLLTALIADLYYVSIDPSYQPQLFKTELVRELASRKSRKTLLHKLEEFQQQQRKVLEQEQTKGEKFHFDIITVNSYGQEINRCRGSAKQKIENLCNGIENLCNGVNLEMVYIPGGTFMMGSPLGKGDDGEKPRHQVKVQSFFMGKYPITQKQWRAVAALPKINRELEPKPSRFRGDSLPVERVSWYDAVEFCARLSKYTGKNYRLPSEAEWEYACRAGTNTPFHFGETITTDLVNYCGKYTYASEPKGKYRKQTTPVGRFSPNAFGLYDMHGNVWEWCFDDWHDNYEGAPTDGSGWFDNDNNNLSQKEGGVLLRGGSWNDDPEHCRSAYRYISDGRDNDNIDDLIGFRVVCVSGK